MSRLNRSSKVLTNENNCSIGLSKVDRKALILGGKVSMRITGLVVSLVCDINFPKLVFEKIFSNRLGFLVDTLCGMANW